MALKPGWERQNESPTAKGGRVMAAIARATVASERVGVPV